MSEAFRLISRPNCHLCDEARPIVLGLVSRYGGRVVEVDVESDDQLIREYSMRIPVILDPSGVVIAEGAIDRSDLKRTLKAWSRRQT